ncbi:oligosaccharide flippase family protein [Salegentibacter salegens]|nr:oligosaccharide flippase family protein [Salegentibacter salegens]
MIKKILGNIVFKNFSYLTIGTVIAQLISLITVLRITDILDPEDYGLFTFLIAQGLLLIRIGDLGNRNIIIRTIAKNPSQTNDLLVNGAILRILALIVLFSIYSAYNYNFGSLSFNNLILIYVFSFLSCFSNLFELIFHGNQKMLPSAIINLVYSIIWFIIVYFILKRGTSITFIFLLYISITLVKGILYLVFIKYYRLFKGSVQSFKVSSRQIMKESWPYFAMLLILLPLTDLANNFLDINSTNDEIGYYNLSERLLGPISLVVGMSLSAIFPNLSAMWSNNKEKFHNYISIGFGVYMIASMLICFIFTLFSKEIIILLFPDGYLSAIKVSQMKVWYLFFMSVDSLVGVFLGAANREKLILRFSIFYFLICTPVLFYSSNFGALGISYGYVISYGIGLIYVWFTFKKSFNIKIKYDLPIWTLALSLFIISYFLTSETSLVYKLIICVSILGILIPYTVKKYKPLITE